MDKYQIMSEVGRVYDERDRWRAVADRVTAERNAAWNRLMSLTGTNRASDVPEGEELLAGRLMRYARRKLLKECFVSAPDPRLGESVMDFDTWADKAIQSWSIPDELSREDVKTVLDSELRKLYEDAKREEDCDE